MPRSTIKVIIPKNPDDMLSLSGDILAKHTADGAASVLPDDIADGLDTVHTAADLENTNQKDFYRDAENFIEQRDLVLGLHHTQDSRTENTVLFYVSSVRDVLSGLHRNNIRNLGKWGFTVNSPNNVAQVVIPLKVDRLLKLTQKILAKHTADGAASPLPTAMMTALAGLNTSALNLHDRAQDTYKSAENATENRNKLLGLEKNQNSKTPDTVLFYITSIRTLLLGLNRGNEQNLGQWGFTVNTSGPTPPPPPPPGP